MKRKTDKLKRALQATVLEMIHLGEQRGLSPRQHLVLQHAMKELGWGVPKEIDIDRVVEELTSEDSEDIKGIDDPRRQGKDPGSDPLTTNGDTP